MLCLCSCLCRIRAAETLASKCYDVQKKPVLLGVCCPLLNKSWSCKTTPAFSVLKTVLFFWSRWFKHKGPLDSILRLWLSPASFQCDIREKSDLWQTWLNPVRQQLYKIKVHFRSQSKKLAASADQQILQSPSECFGRESPWHGFFCYISF